MANSGLNAIGDDVYVYLGNYQEEVRIKIKKLKEGAEGRKEQDGNKAISLTMDQWETLCLAKEEISEHISLVKDRDAVTKRAWRLSPNRFVSVDRIRSAFINAFVTLINIRVYFMGGTDLPDNPTRYGITLKPSQWTNLVSKMDNINTSIRPDREEGKRKQLLLELLADKMLDMVEEASKEKCVGCKVDHPSQVKHMSGGCLSEADEKISYYYDECKGKIKELDNKVTVFRKALMLTDASDESKIWGELLHVIETANEEIKVMMTSPREEWEFVIRP